MARYGYRIDKIKHNWNFAEFDRIRNSPGTQRLLQNNAGRVVHFAGHTGYVYHVVRGKKRAHAYIRPLTKEAEEDNLKMNTLIKSLHYVRRH